MTVNRSTLMRCGIKDHVVHYRIKSNMPVHCITCDPPPVKPGEVGWYTGDGTFISIGRATRGSIRCWDQAAKHRELSLRLRAAFGIDLSEWEVVYHATEDDGWPNCTHGWID